MAIDDYFCHLCTIERPQGEEVRGTNGEILTPPTDLVTAQPCRLTTKTQRLASPEGWVTLTTYSLFLPVNDGTKGLKMNDIVSKVILEDLSDAGSFTVAAVVPQMGKAGLHHITLDLEKVA